MLCCLAATAGPASADSIPAPLVTFMPGPASANYEAIWNGTELFDGPGVLGTGFNNVGAGDGEDPTATQYAPGLTLETPYTVSGIPGSQVNANTGATTFYDATLDIIPIGNALYGLKATGPAQSLGGYLLQPLGSAEFKIWSTDPKTPAGADNDYTLLLSGLIENAWLAGPSGMRSGSVIGNVTYTGGAIFDASEMLADGGEFSWSLTGIAPALALDSASGYLRGFQAHMVGQFDAVPTPEPGQIVAWLTAMPLMFFGARYWQSIRRRRRAV